MKINQNTSFAACPGLAFKTLALLFSLSMASQALAQPDLQLANFASGFTRPVDIAHCGDDRLFIVEQRGIIWILDENGVKLPQPFLNIDPQVGSGGNEQGLLGLAFHPDYGQNGFFYVNYTNNSGDTRLSRFSVQAGNPNQADPNSELVLLQADQPYSNHNGGCVKFGPDGYLYTGLGDGGSGGDPQNNSQKRSTLLGKMLRIDVDGASPYAIPADNPFVNDNNTLDEIWALGLRNPWRFSFDRLTGDLWIGDVGQDDWEEIDFQPAASPGGENYGWRCYEGTHTYNTTGCPPASQLTAPVAEYQNSSSQGCSVTGGYVYRGCRYPGLYGRYLYTDYCSGIIWSLLPDGSGGWQQAQLANLVNNQFVSFGENRRGELFLAGLGNGIIYRLTDNSSSFDYEIAATSPVCPSDATGSLSLQFSGSMAPGSISWSNGENGAQTGNLPAGSYDVTITGANGCSVSESIVLGSQIGFSSSAADETCPGAADGSIDLTVSGNVEPVQYAWSDGVVTPDRSGLGAGDYSVTITTDEGCTFVEQFSIATLFEAPPVPTIAVSSDSLLSTSDNYEQYQWYLDGNPIPGANQSSHTATQSGSYTLLATDVNGCEAVSAAVDIQLSSGRWPEHVTLLRLSPNPFRQSLRLEMEAAVPVSLAVTLADAGGKAVLERSIGRGRSFLETFDLRGLPPGVYIFGLKTSTGQEWHEKVVKEP